MGKPVREVTLTTPEEKTTRATALFDSGSFYTILRQDLVPPETHIVEYKTPREFKTAGQEGKVRITGFTELVIAIGDKMINDRVLVSGDLRSEMLIGAGTMQQWDITLKDENGKTEIIVGKDMRDPEITEVD